MYQGKLKEARLQLLTFQSFSNLLDTHIFEISKSIKNLQQIVLQDCIRIEDSSVAALAIGCPTLTHIDFSNCTSITTQAFHHLCKATNLTELVSAVQ
jgi:hypothetical protein